MRTPIAARMSRSSTPARTIMPMRVRLSASHIATPITTEAGEDHQPHVRVEQIDRFARGFDRGDERQLDRPDQPGGRLDLIEIAAEHPQHQVGEHDRKADRHHRLPEILPLHAAEHEQLHQHAEHGGDDEGDDEGQQPRAGRVARTV